MPLRDSNSNNESKEEEEEVADDDIPIANDEDTDTGEELNNDKVKEGKTDSASIPPTPIIKKERIRRKGYAKDVTCRPEDYYAAIISYRSSFDHMKYKAFCESPHSGPNITGSKSHQNSFRRYLGLQKTGKFKNPLGADEGVHVPKVQTPTQTTDDVFDFPGEDNSNTTTARTHRRTRRNKRKRDTGSTQRVLRSSKRKKNKNTAVGNATTKKRKKK